jgi:hypothetical protein
MSETCLSPAVPLVVAPVNSESVLTQKKFNRIPVQVGLDTAFLTVFSLNYKKKFRIGAKSV